MILLILGAVLLIAGLALYVRDRRPGRGPGRGPVILWVAGLICLAVGLWEWVR